MEIKKENKLYVGCCCILKINVDSIFRFIEFLLLVAFLWCGFRVVGEKYFLEEKQKKNFYFRFSLKLI